MSNYTGNPIPGLEQEERRQQLLAMQEQIQRELASIPASNDAVVPSAGLPSSLLEYLSTPHHTQRESSRNHASAQAMSRNFSTVGLPRPSLLPGSNGF